MLLKIHSILFLTLTLQAVSQKSPRISYFSKDGNLADLEDAYYFRQSTDTLNFYRSYYVASKNCYFKGSIIKANDSLDKNNLYAGNCTWFYPNGNKMKEYQYDNKGVLNGMCEEYYENGNLKKEIEFISNKPNISNYTAYTIKGAKSNVHEDPFTNNENNWQVFTNTNSTSKLKLGGLELACMKNTSLFSIPTIKVNSANYMLEVTINSNYLRDSIYKAGLVFEYKNALNYSFYYISHNRRYIGKVKEGITTKILDDFYTPELNPYALNKIQALRLGNKMYYATNNTILLCHIENDSVQAQVGLSTKGIGSVLFDNFIIHEYDKTIDIGTIFTDKNYFNIKEEDFGIKSISSGLVLDKSGLILTNYDNVKKNNSIQVQLYVNDTLKKYNAVVLAKDVFHNLAFLKLTNLGATILEEPHYTFFQKPAIKTGSALFTNYFTRYQFDDVKIASIKGVLKSPALFENFLTSFETSMLTEQQALGAPVFTEDGELLGMVNQAGENSSALKLTHVLNLLFSSQQKITKYRTPSVKDIYKNCVMIKVR
jgi:hypothetical protein